MRVYLCRHAEAAPGEPDEDRELTRTGVSQVRALGERLARLPAPPVLVLSSPLARARRTAEAIADAVDVAVRVEPLLAPGATLEALQRAITGLDGAVATVGHQPDCSEIALALTGVDPGFPPAGEAALEL
jgi:phosphohistidine phosphatase